MLIAYFLQLMVDTPPNMIRTELLMEYIVLIEQFCEITLVAYQP